MILKTRHSHYLQMRAQTYPIGHKCQLWLGINAIGPFNNFIDLAFQKAEKNSKHNNAFALSYYNLIFSYLSNENFRLHGRCCLKSTNFGVLRVFLNLNIVDVCKIFLKLRYLDDMKYVSK